MRTEVWNVTLNDGFFAKDGRGWFAGGAGRGRTMEWPLPTTVRGAICTAIGRVREAKGSRLGRQDWLNLKEHIEVTALLAARTCPGQEPGLSDRMWRAPSDGVAVQPDRPVAGTGEQRCEVKRLMPATSGATIWDSGRDPTTAAISPMFIDDKRKPAAMPAWWSESDFVDWLLGASAVTLGRTRFASVRHDTHVKIDSRVGTADPGMLWTAETRETVDRDGNGAGVWSLLASLVLDELADVPPPEMLLLGGDRRIGNVEVVQDMSAPPAAFDSCERESQRLRIICVSPGSFAGGWRPDGFELRGDTLVGALPGVDVPVRLVSACVGRALPVSGWNMQAAGGEAPRVTDWTVPPGATYVVEAIDPEHRFNANTLRDCWLAQWGARSADGFGRFVAGLEPITQPTLGEQQ